MTITQGELVGMGFHPAKDMDPVNLTKLRTNTESPEHLKLLMVLVQEKAHRKAEPTALVRGRTFVRFVSNEFYSDQPESEPPRVRNGVEVFVHGITGAVEHQAFFPNAPEQGRKVLAFILEWDTSLWCSKCGNWTMELGPGDPKPAWQDYLCGKCAANVAAPNGS